MSVYSGPPCSRSSSSSSEQSYASDGPPFPTAESKTFLFPEHENLSTTQAITTSSPEELHTALTAPSRRGVQWVCQMGHGGRLDTNAWPSTPATVPHTGKRESREENATTAASALSSASSSGSTISSHEGSFYASLRMEQKIQHQQQRQQQQQRRRLRNRSGTGGPVASPTSALVGLSEHTSNTSFQPEIIYFGSTPSSASPTTTANGQAWSASTGQTPSSPFTPFSPSGVYQQQAAHYSSQPVLHQLQDQESNFAYRAYRPARLVCTAATLV